MSKSLTILLLAAGCGSRLRPYTNDWPKCLMPINGEPLLGYWLDIARQIKADRVLVNLHYLANTVQKFLDRPIFKHWVQSIYEPELKGTAGTLIANKKKVHGSTVLLAHADNFCQCDFNDFLTFHQHSRPNHCPITMMTFDSKTPRSCGIVEVDQNKVVTAFYEKQNNPPGNRANGAVYLLEPEVIEWMCNRPQLTDFSTQVIPHFVGRIATWHNNYVHLDIGVIEALREAQSLPTKKNGKNAVFADEWSKEFLSHPIHQRIWQGME